MSASAGPTELVRELTPHIADRRVLDAIAAVPRERFVAARLANLAWTNVALPIGEGQTISQPLVVGRMCELLELDAGDRVLDVGTGSGYHAAVLAQLAREVISIERHRSLSDLAAANLVAAGVDGVRLVVGDGAEGWPRAAPYDAINVAAGSAHGIPQPLLDQLADGGRLVIPVDVEGGQRLVRVRRRGGDIERADLDPVRFVPLVRRP